MQLSKYILSEIRNYNIQVKEDDNYEARAVVALCKALLKDILKRFRTQPQNVNPKLISYLINFFGELTSELDEIHPDVQTKLIKEGVVTSVDGLVQKMDSILGELRTLELTFPIKVSAIKEGDRNKLKEFNADFGSCIKRLSDAIRIIKQNN